MLETNNNFNEKGETILSRIKETHKQELSENLYIINGFNKLFTEGSELILKMEDFLSKNKNDFDNEYKKLTKDIEKKQYLYRRINYIESKRDYFSNIYHKIESGIWTFIKRLGSQEEKNIYQKRLNFLNNLWFSVYGDINHTYFKYKDIYKDFNLIRIWTFD